MEPGTIFIIVFVLVIVIMIIRAIVEKTKSTERKSILDAKISELPNKDSILKIIGLKNRYAFILDKVDKKIYHLTAKQNEVVSFDQIISVEVIEDNKLLSSKSTTRTIGGAILGGALAGGAGMVVGGLSGDTKQKKSVSEVTVKIKKRDYSNPTLKISCFVANELTWGDVVKSDDVDWRLYKEELKNAQKIADYVSVIIDEVDRQEKKSQSLQNTSFKTSVADELEKLARLKADGILTEEEFQIQKAKLMG